jgi:ABC-2 type transport system ATP-binding protein
MSMIEIEGLHKEYRRLRGGRTVAVAGLDLSVPGGGVFGFLGPNGAGKTTTIRCLLGLVRPSSGRLSLLGADVGHALPSVIGRVGSIVEAPAMFPRFSGRRNLEILARIHGEGDTAIDASLERVGLRDRAKDAVKTYSLGMKQRLAIAATLLRDPSLLILDEPANGLDPEGIAWMRTLLREFADRGGTVLLSSHLLHEVQATADHLIVISDGAVVAAGRLDELLASSTILVRSPDPDALAAALRAARIDYVAGPRDALIVDVSGGRVTTEVLAGVARDHQVLLTELRRSETDGLEQLFFSLTAAKAAPPQEAAA